MSSIISQVNTLNQLNQNFFQPLSTVQKGQKVRVSGGAEEYSKLSLKVDNLATKKLRGMLNYVPSQGDGTLQGTVQTLSIAVNAAVQFSSEILPAVQYQNIYSGEIAQAKEAIINLNTSLKASTEALSHLYDTYVQERDSGKHTAEDRVKILDEKQRIVELSGILDDLIAKFSQ